MYIINCPKHPFAVEMTYEAGFMICPKCKHKRRVHHPKNTLLWNDGRNQWFFKIATVYPPVARGPFPSYTQARRKAMKALEALEALEEKANLALEAQS